MKKIFLLVASALLATSAFAVANLGNPKADLFEDGVQWNIVKWDCEFNDWADAEDALVEFDETFIFAVDITPITSLVDYIAEYPNSRTVGLNLWSNYAAINGVDFRLEHIKDNIYGAKINFAQYAAFRGKAITEAMQPDAAFVLEGQLFGASFAGNPDNLNEWFVAPVTEFSGEGNQIFSTLPYTGTKSSEEFTNSGSEIVNGDTVNDVDAVGYAAPNCGASGIGDVTVDGKTIVGYYTILGVELEDEPASGIFIEKYSDGTSAKIVK